MSVSTFEYVKDALKYKSLGNFALAETALQRALKLDPNSISTMGELAVLKMDQELYKEALDIIAEINETKTLPVNVFRRAACLFKLGREAEALSALTDLELMQYDFRGAWELRAEIYLEHNQIKEALECINIEIKNNPENVHLISKRAEIYLKGNKREEALADYKKICLADYKNVKSYVPYVELLVEDGDLIEANTFLKQSKMYGQNDRLDELNAYVCEQLGIVLK